MPTPTAYRRTHPKTSKRRRERFHRVAPTSSPSRPSPKRVCIDILPNSGNLLIDGNIFNMDGTAIRNRSQVSSRCIGNVYTGSPDFTKSADGANALIRYVDPNGTLKTLDFE